MLLCRRQWGDGWNRGIYLPALGLAIEGSFPGASHRPGGRTARSRQAPRTAIVSEAACILEEGIAASRPDINLVLINGYGYPTRRGGPIFSADRVGLGEVPKDNSGAGEGRGEGDLL
jgi:hypothetical protein